MDILSAIALAAAINNVNPALLKGLCYKESTHNPSAYVQNDGGSPSIGLCQIKLATARAMGFKGLTVGLFDPFTNANYAAKYLRHQYERYHSWKKAISAYNAGHASHKNTKYVKRVIKLAYEF